MSLFATGALTGERALVTGASSGLGAHFAEVLARHGADVILAARRLDALERTAEKVRFHGRNATVVQMDVCDAASVDAGVREAVEKAGTPTILVNNSGIAMGGRFVDIPDAEFESVVETNLHGVFRVGQRVARAMVAAGIPGRIVNIGSIAGVVAGGQFAAYSASKAAVLHLTKTMALELARSRIRVNAIAPGYFETEMNAAFFGTEKGKAMIARIPLRRLGRLEELDAPLLFLASEASGFVTGSVVTIDGGHSLGSV